MSNLLETRDLTRRFGRGAQAQDAVRDVSVHLRRGAVCGLLGPNGAGKSTLLKMVCGMLRPTSGQILFDGMPWRRENLYRIGSLIEEAPLYPNLTAREDLRVRTTLLGLPERRVDDGLVPAAYCYVWLDDGSLIATDGDEHGVVAAIDAVEELGGEGSLAATDEVRSIGRDGTTYSVFALEDGSVCVLTSTYMPQYVTRGLRDALPNPQDLMLVAGCALSVGAVALVARRAARVISRKMAPLTEAAERIAREELDFAVEGSNVREVDDVLSAMERMRASLAESLEARWRSERAAREQVAALAHDLKTPLTVVRANADLLSEEAAELGAAGEGLAESARAVAEGAAQLDGYVGLLVEASHGEAGEVRRLRTGARDLAARLADSAGRLAAARDVSLAVERDVTEGAVLLADVAAVERAVSNLVGNACDHAAGRVTLALREEGGALVVAVGDDGPGFSPAALEHARERLWRDDASRGGARGHYGLGLAIADEVARAHGGSLELSNAPAGGAVATLRLPLA